MEIKFYNALPEEAAAIRTEVFIEEQGFKNELDDMDSCAEHLGAVAYSGSAFASFPCEVPGCCGSVLPGFPAFADARLFVIVLLEFDCCLWLVIIQVGLSLTRQ